MDNLPHYNQNEFQVWLYSSPTAIPFSFAVHPWFVVNDTQSINRWGISHIRTDRIDSFGHLNKNLLPPTQGPRIFLGTNTPNWKANVIGMIEGDTQSTAAKMCSVINNSYHTYPYKDQYHLIGPNSNTYVQWVLNQFPESNLSLPWNAFGKNWK